jgi:TolB-like protein/Tfp pilus assembly protein PilF
VSFFEELKRRNVFRVGVAYIVSAWVMLQFADLVLENIQAPDWIIKVFMLALATGFPLAIFFAWAFEMTPEGIKKEKDVDRSQSITTQTSRKLDRSIIVILLIAVVYFAWDNFSPAPSEPIPTSETTQQASTAQNAQKSIAVLPFADLSQAQDQEWFADGLSEEILNVLAKTPDLLVSSRTSSFRYKDSNLDIPDIAGELGVAHVLEGSVRSSGKRIRVTAQLIRASDGFHLWSENYDRDVADMIEIQEDLAMSIAKALETTMDPEALAAMTSVGTRSVEAYEEYLRGQAAFLAGYAGSSSDGTQLFKDAYDHFEKARAIDPGFASAHLMASVFWKVQLDPKRLASGLTEVAPLQMLEEFNTRIDRAIKTAPTLIDKKGYMANKAFVELRLRDAIRHYREYLLERPNAEEGRVALIDAAGLASDENTRKELLSYYRMRGLSDRFSAVRYVSDAYRVGDASKAAEFGLQALQRWPNYSDLLYQTHRTLMWAGRIAEGKNLADRYERLNPDSSLLVRARQACAEGRRAEVETILESIDPDDNYARSTRWHVLKLLGREQESAAVLQPYVDSGVPFMMTSWLTYPKFDPTPFPVVMAVLDREGINRPPAVDIPFRCPPPEQISIAVLPFVNMSTDADNEFFSDGIAEEILNVLASKGTNSKISQIAEELGVNHVLEGSVRKSGNQVRVTAQLIKADDGFHLWSDNYDRELTNIFAIQDEIAGSIAAALKVSLKLESGSTGNLTGTNSIGAYEHYLKGMSLWHLRTADSLYRSIEEFEAAIGLDPQFAKAHAGLALNWTVIPGYVNLDIKTAQANTLATGNKALSLDSENVEAMVALANLKSDQFKYEEAERLFKKVIDLNPSFATAHQWYGNSLGFMGKSQAGLPHLQKAWSLDPRSRIIGANLAWRLKGLDRIQESIDVLEEVRNFAPDFPDALLQLMHVEIINGNCETAREYGNELSNLLRKTVNSTPVYMDLCQRSDPALRASAVASILSWPPLDFSSVENRSLSYSPDLVHLLVELDEPDAAMALIEQNIGTTGPMLLTALKSEKSSRSINFYCDPQFQSLFETKGFPDYGRESICD